MSLVKSMARIYQGWVHKSLAQYGLRYEDIIMAENPDLQRALQYIPEEEVQNRQRRISRAIDLSFKHEYLPKEIEALQEPGKVYLEPLMAEFKAIREEKELLK
ncbi:Cytochrome b-c1 complex subunit 7-2 [Durusdinium trenchii]|uniref:Mitochondrial (Complex III subunit 7-2) (Complex III subunit VII) (Ubiquinol-cytochrome c oxidoreductase subunit 7-2) n=1 Tax=Durusdinium trenchii TaxID=1381693 RepID=A0ABP0I8T3_9DINO